MLAPTLATTVHLKPQARAVLWHLERGRSVSPLEAERVYSIFRLAACIYELRQAGYNIHTELKTDMAGHHYARYTLVK